MAITYTVAECEAEITAIRTKLAELRGLPTSGTVGETDLDHSQTFAELRAEESMWLLRLEQAHRGGTALPRARRVV